MADQIGNALEGHLLTAVILAGVAALAIVAVAGLAWWVGRRCVRHRPNAPPISTRMGVVNRMDDPRTTRTESGTDAPAQPAGPDAHEQQWGSSIVRDAATRAAALREAWDRSYRAARTPSEMAGATTPQTSVLDQLLAEQRLTNELLREVVAELKRRP
ncbi:MAG TPA: hypothetical protein VHK63_04860 [Candidatus Limnocylindria bacterium]|nr:hypothetical protein [Candidatus Limnocylindria bacterium]